MGLDCEVIVKRILTEVVVTAPFINFLLHNHFITEKNLKKKSGDVNDEVKFPFFFYFIRELNLHSPLTYSLTSARELKPILPPYLLPHLRAR